MPSGSISAPYALIPASSGCAIPRLTTVYSAKPPPARVGTVKGDQRTMIVLARSTVQAVSAGFERFHGDELPGLKIGDSRAQGHDFPAEFVTEYHGIGDPGQGMGVVRVVTGPS